MDEKWLLPLTPCSYYNSHMHISNNDGNKCSITARWMQRNATLKAIKGDLAIEKVASSTFRSTEKTIKLFHHAST